MELLAKKVIDVNNTVSWIIFEAGKIDKPLVFLTDIDMNVFVNSVGEQNQDWDV